MVKLLENTFRAVNIGLVNEVALMCDRLGIDVWEVIDAAATKPFGFMPFYPGPGPRRALHPDRSRSTCRGRRRRSSFEARFIELAGQINGAMPHYVVRQGRRRAERRAEGRQRLAGARRSASPTSATSTTCASRRRST